MRNECCARELNFYMFSKFKLGLYLRTDLIHISFMQAIQDFLDQVIFTIGDYSLKVITIVEILSIIIITKLLLWIIKRLLFRQSRVEEHERGNIQAVYQIILYIV